MSDFLEQIGQDLGDAVEQRRHLSRLARVRHIRHRNLLVGLLGALMIATPAVAAVTHWFAAGAPDRFPVSAASEFAGRELPGTTSRLLSLRVADPQGGPQWGMRVLLRTTRGDTCIQIGRVQGSQLGSLGINHAWNDDHLFHAFPADAVTEDCSTTDGAGRAFLNLAYEALPSSAEPTFGARGPQASSCEPGNQGHRVAPICPTGTMRIVFAGLLGPDAKSITYRTPDGSLQTEQTSGPDGAYLLVFTRTARSCERYGWGSVTELASCAGESFSGTNPPTAILSVQYRNHPTCHVVARTVGSETCPPVGYVANRVPHVTHAELATPITVHLIHGRRWCARKGRYHANRFDWVACDSSVPRGYQRFDMVPRHTSDPGVLVDVSLKARKPVTSSRSRYEIFTAYPHSCGSGGTGGDLGFGDIHTGQTLRFQDYEQANCTGTFHGAVSYQQSRGPVSQGAAGIGQPGHDGSILVGRFTYTNPPQSKASGR